jgi:hypothetical protein
MKLHRLEDLEPGTRFRLSYDDAVYTLESVNFTRAVIHSDKTATRTFEVPDKETGEMKRVTITKPIVKDVSPAMEVEVLP